MIHEMTNQSSIPEELYNLTQLADVTLAAGKLSTTNIHSIENKETPTKVSLTSICHANDIIETEPLHSPTKSVNESGYMSEMEITPKQRKLMKMFNTDSEINGHSNIFYATPKKSLIEQRQSSFSSSEDDSTYNYSHKIFDKRKSRQLCYQSDDSEYVCAEHSGLAFDQNPITTETEDSMLSISETESTAEFSSSSKSFDCIGGSDDVHICPECGKKYSTSSNLARHRQTHRSLLDKKARRCPHCDKVYVSMPAFSMHVRTHNQGCECPHCGKRFSRPWLLQGHIRTHTGEKPFQCSICTKAFADKSNLRAHIQTHSHTKPHTCARCGKAFALKSYLYKHEESSCMRNHGRIDKEKNKLIKSDSTSRIKSMKKSTADATTHSKKIKEKMVNILCDKEIQNHSISNQECIIMDVGSKKSYIDLTESRKETESYSRISVIRSVAAQSPNYETQFDFYQEKPVDFSPKHKYKNELSNHSSNENNNNLMEISRQYATMVV